MGAPKDVRLAIQALALTAEQGKGGTRSVLEENDADLMSWLQKYRIIQTSREAWDNLGQSDQFDSFADGRNCVFWPPTRSGDERIVPIVMGVTWHPGSGFGIRLALFRRDTTDRGAIGVRFEQPMTLDDGVGNHEFHHAQLFTRAVRGDDATRLIDPDEWRPESQPSIPVQAKTARDLLWATAVSAYGRNRAHLPFEGMPQHRTELDKYIKALD